MPLPSTSPSSWDRRLGKLAPWGLVALVLVTYAPALDNGFIWDDDEYVTHSRVIHDLDGLRRTWTEPGTVLQYYPVVRTSMWLEHKLWGLAPAGYHATNIALHALAAVLLFTLLGRLRVPGAWLGAALFAVHPVHVESVAWITERKNVLSGVFYLASMLALCRAFGLGSVAAARPARAWALSFVLYVLALLSKSVTASLPAAVLVIMWWQTPTWDRACWRKAASLVPFFVLGALMGRVTVILERDVVGAAGIPGLSPAGHVVLASRALLFYLGKLAWPLDLAFFYERWAIEPLTMERALWSAAAAALVAALWLGRARLGRGPLAAALLFGGTLFPALGFFKVYPHRFSWVADHFQYLASVPVLALAAAAAARLADRVPRIPLDGVSRPTGRALAVRVAAPALVLLALMGLSSVRSLAFMNTLSLWGDTVTRTPSSAAAHQNLGQALLDAGRLADARAELTLAARLDPTAARPLMLLAVIADRQGAAVEAESFFAQALRLDPSDPNVLLNAGSFFARTGRPREALDAYQRAARARPWWALPYVGSGQVLLQEGDRALAARFFERAVALDPRNQDARVGLAQAQAAPRP